jgi:hypothetical protein
MQVEMEIKGFGGIAPPPMPVTKELIADIISAPTTRTISEPPPGPDGREPRNKGE